jgi:D-alanine-D-alanine ligase
MRTGRAAILALQRLGYVTKDITITKDGSWLDNGKVKQPDVALTAIDRVFLALHGTYGEDGTIQRFLTTHHVPYTGSKALASALAFNKSHTKSQLTVHGIQCASHWVCATDDDTKIGDTVRQVQRAEIDQVVVKPIQSGSSVDTYVGIGPDQISAVIKKLHAKYSRVMIEAYLPGREVTVGVLDNFRSTSRYVLPVIEVCPPSEHSFYSYTAKYSGVTELQCPASLHTDERRELARIATMVHDTLNLRHYSRSDFILSKDGIYFLEVNTLPGLTEHSLVPKALEAVGATYDQLIDHLIMSAAY